MTEAAQLASSKANSVFSCLVGFLEDMCSQILPRRMRRTLQQQCLCGAMQFERSLRQARMAASIGHLLDEQRVGEMFLGDLNAEVEC